jgi:hypothetical protein
MKSILDPSFRYVPSHATDVRRTFERIRREREAALPPAQDVELRAPGERVAVARRNLLRLAVGEV